MSQRRDGRHDDETSSGDEPASQANQQVAWELVSADLVLGATPVPIGSGNTARGGDLRLDIGWDRFEQLILKIVQGARGIHGVRYRRYGLAGQAQHGIDLAGMDANGDSEVIQCKDYRQFTASNLRDAVETFATGRRPFNARRFVIATSSVARSTDIEEALRVLQEEHPDLAIELLGAEQINDELRNHPEIVARFWSRETATEFCTGAPLPGLPLPAPNWLQVADQVLRGPLDMGDELADRYTSAGRIAATDPVAAAALYGEIADRLSDAGFGGHAHVVRTRQLDALAKGGQHAKATCLVNELAVIALHSADTDHARMLAYEAERLANLVEDGPLGENARRNAGLVQDAYLTATHQLADHAELEASLSHASPENAPSYFPVLVLLLGELSCADALVNPLGLPAGGTSARLDRLVKAAISAAEGTPLVVDAKEVAFRLRLLRSSYDIAERTALLRLARRHQMARHQAALVLAAEARRNAIAGAVDEAIEHWRQAVALALHDERPEDASGWLYAIRHVRTQFGPWAALSDDEHRLAQALPRASKSRLLARVRDPESDARRAFTQGRFSDAARNARRWLADSVVAGDWADEHDALDLLGDVYARNQEPARAAICYQRNGELKKLEAVARAAGDSLLPRLEMAGSAWWEQMASLAVAEYQADLISDSAAGLSVGEALAVVDRSQAGELLEPTPAFPLTSQALMTAAALVGRVGTEDAARLLGTFSLDLVREPGTYKKSDPAHFRVITGILRHHPDLASVALDHLLILAETGVHGATRALMSLGRPDVLGVRDDAEVRLLALANAGNSGAGHALVATGPTAMALASSEWASAAADNITARTSSGGRTAFIGGLDSDAYLASVLPADRRAGLVERLLGVAASRDEAAVNRRDALLGCAYLLDGLPADIRARARNASRVVLVGDPGASAFDDEVTSPHPLSDYRVDFGSASLRPGALSLARSSADSEADWAWLTQQAAALLCSSDESEVCAAVRCLGALPSQVRQGLDPLLLAANRAAVVRQLAALLAAASPVKYEAVLDRLAADSVGDVRRVLAEALLKSVYGESSGPATSENSRVLASRMLAKLAAEDPRWSVRCAARTGGEFGD